jgi:tetratricopeptide (TPR) repeat protein
MKRLSTLFLAFTVISCGQTKPATPDQPTAADACWLQKKLGQTDKARSCFENLTRSGDRAMAAEGFWGLRQFGEANNAFRDALSRDTKSARVRVRWGRMFLDRYNPEEAGKLFAEALEIDENYPPALLGMALVGAEGFDMKAPGFAKKALEANPKLVEAQELLAHLALEDMNTAKAVEEADKAIAMSEQALDAMAIRATVELLADRPATPWLDRMAKVNPQYSGGYARIAHHLVINRRYEDGIDYYRKSIQMDPSNDAARSELGVNLMRIGQEGEARQLLELAYENGWRDNPTVNTLRLMDSYKNYVTIEGPKSIVKLHKKEADLLKLYIPAELERAIATYEKKYKLTVPGKVQLEVYPDHEDFAVRTMGMPGLGALGVTFGTVVAMDSPSGRPPAQFHWASTLWHELSHVFVLSATKHRTPRWFTEGWAVHEETAASPEWGDRMTPQIVDAVKNKKLLPIAELDRGFIRPSYPAQVIVSYFQGGKICDYITERWGYQKLIDMMNDFAGNHPTAEVVERQLKLKPEEFDTAFLGWLDNQIGDQVRAFDDWQKRMKGLNGVVKDGGETDVILKEAEALAKLFPEYVEKGSAYEVAASASEKKGDKTKAREWLSSYVKAGGREPAMLRKLSDLQDAAGDQKGAAATLEKLNMIYPVHDEVMHTHLGQLYTKLGNPRLAIREWQAVLAESPIDKASAHYELARAYMSSGDNEQAESNLLDALEAAPGFKPAQKMLLELSSGRKENP